jgi:hypothetical protein
MFSSYSDPEPPILGLGSLNTDCGHGKIYNFQTEAGLVLRRYGTYLDT